MELLDICDKASTALGEVDILDGFSIFLLCFEDYFRSLMHLMMGFVNSAGTGGVFIC